MSSDEDLTTGDSGSDLEKWERLLNEQTVLFERTSTKNKDLQARVEELERELSVWKSALKAADDEKKLLSKAVLKLEKDIGSLKDNNTLLLCLIDGDGSIFSADLISLGQTGGHQAALLLTKGLTEHVADIDSSSRGQVWLTVFCNKTGLLETLISNGVCTAEQFEGFVTGFNQASPLFSFVDVGSGKERADEKIKEYLRIFTRFSQISKVFFGGSHDNGYISTLNYLQNEGLLYKIIMLRGYKETAYELRNLYLPSLYIDNLFMRKKLQSPINLKAPPAGKSTYVKISKTVPSTIQAQDFDKFRAKNAPSASSNSSSHKKSAPAASEKNNGRQLTPNLPLSHQRPLPCNFYYLADCKHGAKCRYSHDYELTTEHVDELREFAKLWPCPYVNRAAPCPYGDTCCMGHACPKGSGCSYKKAGKCKFIGAHMHDRVSKSHHNVDGNKSSSPANSSPANHSHNNALAASPLSSPTSSTGPYHFSMSSDGRPIFTSTSNTSEPSTNSLLARLGKRVETPVDDNDYDENVY